MICMYVNCDVWDYNLKHVSKILDRLIKINIFFSYIKSNVSLEYKFMNYKL